MSEGDGYRCLILASVPLVNYVVLPCWRKNIREAKGVDGNLLFDCLASYCCPCCTIFQVPPPNQLTFHSSRSYGFYDLKRS